MEAPTSVDQLTLYVFKEGGNTIMQSDWIKFANKKSYEICYALFRLSDKMGKRSFSDRLEERGLDLFESAVSGDLKNTNRTIDSIKSLIGFGADVGLIHSNNSETLKMEIKNLEAAIEEIGNAARVQEVDFGNIFSMAPAVVNSSNAMQLKATETISMSALPSDLGSAPDSLENGNGSHSLVKAAIRQSAILERIRQNGNCRLKELQEILPEVSERTVRYDLQRLLEQGMVERIGNGGPATHYRAKEAVSMVSDGSVA